MKANKKILLALDGSEQSLTAARYISRVVPKQFKVVLFHVEAEVPEAFRDMNVDPVTGRKAYPLRIWKVHQKELIDEFMQKAGDIFGSAGFAPESVSVKSQSLKSGIARDILNESHQNYSALIMGRTGNNKIDDIIPGSVTAKLVEVVAHIPIVVVGDTPDSNKILVAFDGSKGSMNSVNCVGHLLDPHVCELMLCHVIRPLSMEPLNAEKLFISKHETQWIDANKRKIVPAILEATKRLKDAGFSEDRISQEILTYEKSRAAAITKAARAGGYDTIVLGRRGYTSVGDFQIGRVSRKILHFAYQPALWIVN